jgi:alanine dehydrogenase
MNIGIPKETRPFEYRVGLSPSGVQILVQGGHKVYVEHDAGLGAGFSDQQYEQAGARIVYSPHEVFGRADLLLKVARPLFEELTWLQPGATLMGLLHLSSARQDKIDQLLQNKITAIAYEQIQKPDGSHPVLQPFSQIGGRLSAQIAARLLENDYGGKGIMLGGIVGVPPAEVLIIGGGVVGKYATRAFVGMGAHVTVLDTDLNQLRLVYEHNPSVITMISNEPNIARACAFADVVVSCVMISGQRAPVIITREMVRSMKPRSLIMDISIDQGGSVETSRPTTHDRPTFVEEGVIHYCVPNIPGIVARTSTHAFVNAALSYIEEVANLGTEAAIARNPGIAAAVNTRHGELVNLTFLSPASGRD